MVLSSVENRKSSSILHRLTARPSITTIRPGSEDLNGNRMRLVSSFHDDRWSKNRSVTDVGWSTKVRKCCWTLKLYMRNTYPKYFHLTDNSFHGIAPRIAGVILQQKPFGSQRARWYCLRVEHSLGRPSRVCLPLAIGCSHCALLGLSPQPYHRRHLLWTDSSLGHSCQVLARPEDSSLRGWPYPSSVRPRHGWHSKRS